MSTIFSNNQLVWQRPASVLDNTTYLNTGGFDPRARPVVCVGGGIYNVNDYATVLPNSTLSGWADSNIAVPTRPAGSPFNTLIQDLSVTFVTYCSTTPGGFSRVYSHIHIIQDGAFFSQVFYAPPTGLFVPAPPEKKLVTVSAYEWSTATWKPSPGSGLTPVSISRPTRIVMDINPEIFQEIFLPGDTIQFQINLTSVFWIGTNIPGGGADIFRGERFRSMEFFTYEQAETPPVAPSSKNCIVTPAATGTTCIINASASKSCIIEEVASKSDII